MISPMNTPRAFFASTTIAEQYLYVFGGMSDYRIVNSIEKYDVVTDTWISLYFKLPMPLSKHSAVGIDQKTILIFGGMSADFEPVNNVWSLDLNIAKFTMKRSM